MKNTVFLQYYFIFISLLSILFATILSSIILVVQEKSIFGVELFLYIFLITICIASIYFLISYLSYKKVEKDPFRFFDLLNELPEKKYDEIDLQAYIDVVEELCTINKLPIPELYVLDYDGINGFISVNLKDDKDFSIALTKGTLKLLTKEELKTFIKALYLKLETKDVQNNILITSILLGINQIFLSSSELFTGSKAIKRNYFRSNKYHVSKGARNGLDNFKTRKNKNSGLVGLGFVFVGVYVINYLWKRFIKNKLRKANDETVDRWMGQNDKINWIIILQKIKSSDLGTYMSDKNIVNVELLGLFAPDIHIHNNKGIKNLQLRISILEKK